MFGAVLPSDWSVFVFSDNSNNHSVSVPVPLTVCAFYQTVAGATEKGAPFMARIDLKGDIVLSHVWVLYTGFDCLDSLTPQAAPKYLWNCCFCAWFDESADSADVQIRFGSAQQLIYS